MNVARLNRLMTLEAPTLSPDGGGGVVAEWRALGSHWAALSPRSGGERGEAGLTTSRVSHRATLRWTPEGDPARPRPEQRLREGARVFDILAVAEDRERRFVTCWLEERRRA